MIDYAAVLLRRYKGREWQLNGDEYEGLVILDGGAKPTQKELDDAWPEVQAEMAAESQQRIDAAKSARNKLKALGLTDAEIAALGG